MLITDTYTPKPIVESRPVPVFSKELIAESIPLFSAPKVTPQMLAENRIKLLLQSGDVSRNVAGWASSVLAQIYMRVPTEVVTRIGANEGSIVFEISSRRYVYEMSVHENGAIEAYLSIGDPAKAHLEDQRTEYVEFESMVDLSTKVNSFNQTIFSALSKIARANDMRGNIT